MNNVIELIEKIGVSSNFSADTILNLKFGLWSK